MLRNLLIAGVLLATSGASFAHDGGYGYGRVVSVEPRFTISFGTYRPDGFQVLYESGGYRYRTYTSYYPGPRIVLPPPYRVERVYYRDYGWDRDDHGWDRRRGDRHDWRDERRGPRHGHRSHDD